MDLFFPNEDRDRLEFMDSAMKIGFEELAAECTANVHLLQPHDRLSVLLLAWKKIGDFLTHNQYAPCVGNTVSWVGRYTLDLWFGRDWITCLAEHKTSLIEHMMKVYPSAYVTMHPYSWPYMFSIYRDPWMVEYLNVHFQRMNGPDISDILDSKDSEFIQQEGISLIILRMINMFDFGMIKLVKHLCSRLLLASQDPTSSANSSMLATPNSAEYIDYVRHIYLIALCESNTDFHHVLGCIQKNLVYNSNGSSPFERAAQIIAKGLKESNKTLTEFLNAFLHKVPERKLSNLFGGAVNKYIMFLTECQIRKLHSLSSLQLSLPDDDLYKKLVKMFINQRESSEELMKTTALVSERLFSGVHNLKALQYSYEQIKQRTRSEWYSTKIVLLLGIIREELNTLENYKYNDDQEADEIILKEQELAIFYRDLAKLLVKIPYLEQEAWLTTFSLHPCKEYMDAVAKCGTRNLRAIKKQALKYKDILNPQSETVEDNKKENKSVAVVVQDKEKNVENVLISDDKKTVDDAVVQDTNQLQPTSTPVTCVTTNPPQVPYFDDNLPCTSKAFLASFGPSIRILEGEKPPAKFNCDIKQKSTPQSKKTQKTQKLIKTITKGKRGRPFGVKSTKVGGRNPSESKASKVTSVKSLQITKPIVAKPDAKDKNSADVVYAAAAGAADSLPSQTADTIKYPAFALINYVTDTEDLIKYTDYEETIPQYKELNSILNSLQLLDSNRNDLLALIISPRYKRLAWLLCWKNLRKRCRDLLTKENKKKFLVLQSMADANTRLTHLHIDYDKYKDKPQLDYGTIEFGYECFDTESGEDALKPVVADPQIAGVRQTKKKPVSRTKKTEPLTRTNSKKIKITAGTQRPRVKKNAKTNKTLTHINEQAQKSDVTEKADELHVNREFHLNTEATESDTIKDVNAVESSANKNKETVINEKEEESRVSEKVLEEAHINKASPSESHLNEEVNKSDMDEHVNTSHMKNDAEPQPKENCYTKQSEPIEEVLSQPIPRFQIVGSPSSSLTETFTRRTSNLSSPILLDRPIYVKRSENGCRKFVLLPTIPTENDNKTKETEKVAEPYMSETVMHSEYTIGMPTSTDKASNRPSRPRENTITPDNSPPKKPDAFCIDRKRRPHSNKHNQTDLAAAKMYKPTNAHSNEQINMCSHSGQQLPQNIPNIEIDTQSYAGIEEQIDTQHHSGCENKQINMQPNSSRQEPLNIQVGQPKVLVKKPAKACPKKKINMLSSSCQRPPLNLPLNRANIELDKQTYTCPKEQINMLSSNLQQPQPNIALSTPNIQIDKRTYACPKEHTSMFSSNYKRPPPNIPIKRPKIEVDTDRQQPVHKPCSTSQQGYIEQESNLSSLTNIRLIQQTNTQSNQIESPNSPSDTRLSQISNRHHKQKSKLLQTKKQLPEHTKTSITKISGVPRSNSSLSNTKRKLKRSVSSRSTHKSPETLPQDLTMPKIDTLDEVIQLQNNQPLNLSSKILSESAEVNLAINSQQNSEKAGNLKEQSSEGENFSENDEDEANTEEEDEYEDQNQEQNEGNKTENSNQDDSSEAFSSEEEEEEGTCQETITLPEHNQVSLEDSTAEQFTKSSVSSAKSTPIKDRTTETFEPSVEGQTTARTNMDEDDNRSENSNQDDSTEAFSSEEEEEEGPCQETIALSEHNQVSLEDSTADHLTKSSVSSAKSTPIKDRTTETFEPSVEGQTTARTNMDEDNNRSENSNQDDSSEAFSSEEEEEEGPCQETIALSEHNQVSLEDSTADHLTKSSVSSAKSTPIKDRTTETFEPSVEGQTTARTNMDEDNNRSENSNQDDSSEAFSSEEEEEEGPCQETIALSEHNQVSLEDSTADHLTKSSVSSAKSTPIKGRTTETFQPSVEGQTTARTNMDEDDNRSENSNQDDSSEAFSSEEEEGPCQETIALSEHNQVSLEESTAEQFTKSSVSSAKSTPIKGRTTETFQPSVERQTTARTNMVEDDNRSENSNQDDSSEAFSSEEEEEEGPCQETIALSEHNQVSLEESTADHLTKSSVSSAKSTPIKGRTTETFQPSVEGQTTARTNMDEDDNRSENSNQDDSSEAFSSEEEEGTCQETITLSEHSYPPVGGSLHNQVSLEHCTSEHFTKSSVFSTKGTPIQSRSTETFQPSVEGQTRARTKIDETYMTSVNKFKSPFADIKSLSEFGISFEKDTYDPMQEDFKYDELSPERPTMAAYNDSWPPITTYQIPLLPAPTSQLNFNSQIHTQSGVNLAHSDATHLAFYNALTNDTTLNNAHPFSDNWQAMETVRKPRHPVVKWINICARVTIRDKAIAILPVGQRLSFAKAAKKSAPGSRLRTQSYQATGTMLAGSRKRIINLRPYMPTEQQLSSDNATTKLSTMGVAPRYSIIPASAGVSMFARTQSATRMQHATRMQMRTVNVTGPNITDGGKYTALTEHAPKPTVQQSSLHNTTGNISMMDVAPKYLTIPTSAGIQVYVPATRSQTVNVVGPHNTDRAEYTAVTEHAPRSSAYIAGAEYRSSQNVAAPIVQQSSLHNAARNVSMMGVAPRYVTIPSAGVKVHIPANRPQTINVIGPHNTDRGEYTARTDHASVSSAYIAGAEYPSSQNVAAPTVQQSSLHNAARNVSMMGVAPRYVTIPSAGVKVHIPANRPQTINVIGPHNTDRGEYTALTDHASVSSAYIAGAEYPSSQNVAAPTVQQSSLHNVARNVSMMGVAPRYVTIPTSAGLQVYVPATRSQTVNVVGPHNTDRGEYTALTEHAPRSSAYIAGAEYSSSPNVSGPTVQQSSLHNAARNVSMMGVAPRYVTIPSAGVKVHIPANKSQTVNVVGPHNTDRAEYTTLTEHAPRSSAYIAGAEYPSSQNVAAPTVQQSSLHNATRNVSMMGVPPRYLTIPSAGVRVHIPANRSQTVNVIGPHNTDRAEYTAVTQHAPRSSAYIAGAEYSSSQNIAAPTVQQSSLHNAARNVSMMGVAPRYVTIPTSAGLQVYVPATRSQTVNVVGPHTTDRAEYTALTEHVPRSSACIAGTEYSPSQYVAAPTVQQSSLHNATRNVSMMGVAPTYTTIPTSAGVEMYNIPATQTKGVDATVTVAGQSRVLNLQSSAYMTTSQHSSLQNSISKVTASVPRNMVAESEFLSCDTTINTSKLPPDKTRKQLSLLNTTPKVAEMAISKILAVQTPALNSTAGLRTARVVATSFIQENVLKNAHMSTTVQSSSHNNDFDYDTDNVLRINSERGSVNTIGGSVNVPPSDIHQTNGTLVINATLNASIKEGSVTCHRATPTLESTNATTKAPAAVAYPTYLSSANEKSQNAALKTPADANINMPPVAGTSKGLAFEMPTSFPAIVEKQTPLPSKPSNILPHKAPDEITKAGDPTISQQKTSLLFPKFSSDINSITYSSKSSGLEDEALLDEDKVLNNLLLRPDLKTYKNNNKGVTSKTTEKEDSHTLEYTDNWRNCTGVTALGKLQEKMKESSTSRQSEEGSCHDDNATLSGDTGSLTQYHTNPVTKIYEVNREDAIDLALLAEQRRLSEMLRDKGWEELSDSNIAWMLMTRPDSHNLKKHSIQAALEGKGLFDGAQISTDDLPTIGEVKLADDSVRVSFGTMIRVTIGYENDTKGHGHQSRRSRIDPARVLEDFTRSRRDADSPTVYSSIITWKKVKDGTLKKLDSMLNDMVQFVPNNDNDTGGRTHTWPSSSLNKFALNLAGPDSIAKPCPRRMRLSNCNSPKTTSPDKSEIEVSSKPCTAKRKQSMKKVAARKKPVIRSKTRTPSNTGRKISTRGNSTRNRSAKANKKPLLDEDSDENSDNDSDNIYECATISTANDSDDDDESDYVRRSRRRKVVKPMKLRCVRRTNPVSLVNESGAGCSGIPRGKRRYFAAKSTASSRPNPLPIQKNVVAAKTRTAEPLNDLEKAAVRRYNCVELDVRLTRLTTRQAEMCRKPNVKLRRFPIQQYLKERNILTATPNPTHNVEDKEVKEKEVENNELEEEEIQDNELKNKEMEGKKLEQREIEDKEIEEDVIKNKKIEVKEIEEKEMKEIEIKEKEMEEKEIEEEEAEEEEMEEEETEEEETEEEETEVKVEDKEIEKKEMKELEIKEKEIEEKEMDEEGTEEEEMQEEETEEEDVEDNNMEDKEIEEKEMEEKENEDKAMEYCDSEESGYSIIEDIESETDEKRLPYPTSPTHSIQSVSSESEDEDEKYDPVVTDISAGSSDSDDDDDNDGNGGNANASSSRGRNAPTESSRAHSTAGNSTSDNTYAAGNSSRSNTNGAAYSSRSHLHASNSLSDSPTNAASSAVANGTLNNCTNHTENHQNSNSCHLNPHNTNNTNDGNIFGETRVNLRTPHTYESTPIIGHSPELSSVANHVRGLAPELVLGFPLQGICIRYQLSSRGISVRVPALNVDIILPQGFSYRVRDDLNAPPEYSFCSIQPFILTVLPYALMRPDELASLQVNRHTLSTIVRSRPEEATTESTSNLVQPEPVIQPFPLMEPIRRSGIYPIVEPYPFRGHSQAVESYPEGLPSGVRSMPTASFVSRGSSAAGGGSTLTESAALTGAGGSSNIYQKLPPPTATTSTSTPTSNTTPNSRLLLLRRLRDFATWANNSSLSLWQVVARHRRHVLQQQRWAIREIRRNIPRTRPNIRHRILRQILSQYRHRIRRNISSNSSSSLSESRLNSNSIHIRRRELRAEDRGHSASCTPTSSGRSTPGIIEECEA